MRTDQIFSEQEASEIVRRAIELHEKAAGEPIYTPGITKAELERIASEVGVSPQFLEQAIRETGAFESTKGPLHLTEEFERVIDVELDPDDFDLVTSQLKPFGNASQPSMAQIGRSMKASVWTGISQAEVEISSRTGRTRIRVKSTPLFAFLVGIMPAFMAGSIALGALAEGGHQMAGFAAVIGCAIGGFLAFRTLVRAGHKRARALAEKIKQIVVAESKPG
jgi:hypothetical protein